MGGRFGTDFEELEFLGAGGFGSVVKCRPANRTSTQSGPFYAVKKIPVDETADSSRWVLREASNLARLHHKNIVRYFSAWMEREEDVGGSPDGPPDGLSRDAPGGSLRGRSSVRPAMSGRRGLPMLFPSASTPHFVTKVVGLPQPISSTNLQRSISTNCLAPPDNSPEASSAGVPDDLKAFLRNYLKNQAEDLELQEAQGEESSSETSSSSSESIQWASSESSVGFEHDEEEEEEGGLVFTEGGAGDDGNLVGGSSFLKRTVSVKPGEKGGRSLKSQKTPTTRRTLYIVMEYVEGMTLRQAINQRLFVDCDVAVGRALVLSLLRQLVDGLAHMHQLHCVHRDLKPENVFLAKTKEKETEKVTEKETSKEASREAPSSSPPSPSPTYQLKIGDLGLSTILGPSGLHRRNSVERAGPECDPRVSAGLSVGVGTQFYIAPEVEALEGRYDQAADMYALGVILFEMCVPPFTTGMERYKVLKSFQDKPSAIEATLRSDAAVSSYPLLDRFTISLIANLMSPSPERRMTAHQVRQSLSSTGGDAASLDLILSAPYSYEMLKLLTSLFSRDELPSRAQVFWQQRTNAAVSGLEMRITTEIKAYVHQLLRSFNALQIDLPLVRPSGDTGGGDSGVDSKVCSGPPAFHLLDPSGVALQLPTTLTPLLRDTLPCVQQAAVIRRFAIQSVFHSMRNHSHPESALHLAFDAVVNLVRLNQVDPPPDELNEDRRESLFELEAMRVMVIIVNVFHMWLEQPRVVVSNTKLLPALLHHLFKINENHTHQIAALLRCPKYDRQIVLKKLRELKVENPDQVVKELEQNWLSYSGDLHTFLETRIDSNPILSKVLKKDANAEGSFHPTASRGSLASVVGKLRILDESLSAAFGPASRQIEFQLGVGFNPDVFNSSFVFACALGGERSSPMTAFSSMGELLSVPSIAGDPTSPPAPLLAVGGRIDSTAASAPETGAYTMEMDLQVIMDAVLLNVAVNRLSYKRWKSSWKRSCFGPERVEGSSGSLPVDMSSNDVLGGGGGPEDFGPFDSHRRPFLLLPPSTPVDAARWFEAIDELRGGDYGKGGNMVASTLEVSNFKDKWKQAREVAFAPAILRRFNPMIQMDASRANRGGADRLPSMAVICVQSVDQLAQAYVLKSKLCNLKMTCAVNPEPYADAAKARRKNESADWVVYFSAVRRPGVSPPIRLMAAAAQAYEGEASAYERVQLALAGAERWFDSQREVVARLIQFYVEVLGAMSPTLGHLFARVSPRH